MTLGVGRTFDRRNGALIRPGGLQPRPPDAAFNWYVKVKRTFWQQRIENSVFSTSEHGVLPA